MVNTDLFWWAWMVNIDDPERILALSYARADRRPALAALFALDDSLGQLVRTTREPALGQMRLAWWHERLEALDSAPPPAEPVLEGLAREVLPRGVTGAALARVIEGWDVLIEEDQLDSEALGRFARGRGGRLFVLAARALGAPESEAVEAAGEGWALADLALHLNDQVAAGEARALAAPLLNRATAARWPRAARALGALAHLARMDCALAPEAPRPIGAPRRVGRLLWHRLSGR